MALRRLAASALSLGLWATTAQPGADEGALPPRVRVIATGGTIAGVQNDPADPDVYRAGSLGAAQLLASVPELARHARVEPEQFANVPSPLITPAQWLALSRLEELARDRLPGTRARRA